MEVLGSSTSRTRNLTAERKWLNSPSNNAERERV
jgi:hypothetical protein